MARLKAYFLAGLFVAGILCAPASSFAAMMTYTLDGGNSTMDGTVGSLSFTDATWFLSATAGPAIVTTGAIEAQTPGEPFTLPVYFIPTAVRFSIRDSVNGVTSMSLNDPTEQNWGVGTIDYSSVFSSEDGQDTAAGLGGFFAFDTSGSSFLSDATFSLLTGNGNGDPGVYSNLGTAGIWNGGPTNYSGLSDEGLQNLETSIGTLTIASFEEGSSPTGKFEIVRASVPDTGSTAALLGAGSLVLGAARRRSLG